jgi:hypothetical protein
MLLGHRTPDASHRLLKHNNIPELYSREIRKRHTFYGPVNLAKMTIIISHCHVQASRNRFVQGVPSSFRRA